MKKIFFTFFILIFANNFVFSSDILSETLEYKNYILNSQKNYLISSNVLNLSENQRQNFEQIYLNNLKNYEKSLENLVEESLKIKALKMAKAGQIDLLKEKKKYYKMKKLIEKNLRIENKNLKKLLTREQRAKFSMIKKLERKDYSNSFKSKDFYKTNPQLEHFGINFSNPKS
jgi:hypothetical protein